MHKICCSIQTGFEICDFDEDRDEILEFHNLHKKSDLTDNPTKRFAIVRLGSRRSTRFDRTYISRVKKTFEIELKRQLAQQLRDFILKRDFLGVNRLFLFEILACLERLTYCRYTKPLIDWGVRDLTPLKNHYFSDQEIPKRLTGQALERRNTGLVPCQVTDLVTHRSHKLNYQIVEVLKINQEDNAKLVLILVFCSNLLFDKWKIIKKEKEIENLIHDLNWKAVPANPEEFSLDQDYSIEFRLKDLIRFLNMENETATRKYVTEMLRSLFQKNVNFQVKSYHYFESFIQCLRIEHQQGKESIVYLRLHPFVAHDLLNQSVIVRKDFYENFKKIDVSGHQLFQFSLRVFLNFAIAIATKNDIFIKDAIMCRSMKHRAYQEKHMFFFMEVLDLIRKNLKFVVGMELNGLCEIPVTDKLLSEVFLTYSNKRLTDAKFAVIDASSLGSLKKKKLTS